jgi:hypothetical protein
VGRDGVDEPRREGDVAGPQGLQVELDWLPVDTHVGETAPRGEDRLADVEGGGDPHRLDGDVDARPIRQVHDVLDGLAVAAVDGPGAEGACRLEAVLVDVDR